MLFHIIGATPAVGQGAPVQLLLWLGEWKGQLAGVLTDPPAPLRGYLPKSPHAVRMHQISSLYSIFGDDRIEPISGLDVRNVVDVVFAETVDGSYGKATVIVDGSAVTADVLTYRGLRFAMGQDLVRYPFVLVRPEDSDETWPALSSTPDVSGPT